MRKVFTIISIMMILTLAACGGTGEVPIEEAETTETADTAEIAEGTEAPASETGSKATLAMLHISMADEFHAGVDQVAKELFAESDIEAVSSSCDYDTGVQLQQLEDYLSMDADYIYIATQDSGVLKDTMLEARENGTYIFYYGDDPGDPNMYDVCMMADEATLGDTCAREAAKWIDETFPDAPDGSIEVVTMTMSAYSTISIGRRMDALKNIEQYTSKAVLVDELDLGSDTTPTKAQELVDACMISHPNVRVILSPASFITTAINESLMRTSGIDYENFYIGTVDFNSSLASLIKESETNESVVRCAIGFENPAYPMYDILSGELEVPADKMVPLDIYGVTTENLSDYYTG